MYKTAFVFPGQGSQYVGMGKDLYESFPQARYIFNTAEDILGWDIKKVCFEGPESLLKKTSLCQPAIFTVSICLLEIIRARVRNFPDFVAGLSLGEYSALVCNGTLSFEDALFLVKRRSELMEEQSKMYPGKMTAVIGLKLEEIKKILKDLDDVEIANINCPGQIIVSGKNESLERLKELAEKIGARKMIDLEVSGAFHSKFMYPISKEFKKILERVFFKEPKIPILSNVDARPTNRIERVKENLIRQLYSPVLWEDSVRFMISKNVNRFYEIGPGKILKGLIKRISPDLEVINIEKKEDIIKLLNC
jgi:[acyl-carrier-protein] S-malonyltransferase